MNTIGNNPTVDLNANDLNANDLNVSDVVTKNNFNNKNIEQEIAKNISIKEESNETDTEVSVKQLEMVAQQLQDFVGEMNKGLEFLVDKDSGRDVIKVIDKKNGDLIKQYPSEEVLKLVSKLSEATGALVNEKV